MPNELESLLQQFAAHWGVDRLHADPQNRYRLVLDGSLHIHLFQNGPFIYLESAIGSLPDDSAQSEKQLEQLLTQSLAGLERHEETLCLDPDRPELMLFRRLPARALMLEDLEQALEKFANQLEFWRQSQATPPVQSAPPPLHFIFP